MTFAVEWLEEAEQQLADIWLNASDRQNVTEAARRVEQTLKRDPDTCGESRPGQGRIMFEPPLGVYFRVDHQARVVTVISLGLSKP